MKNCFLSIFILIWSGCQSSLPTSMSLADKQESLLVAIRQGKLAAVEFYLQDGAKLAGLQGFAGRPLATALKQGELTVAKHLIESGASIQVGEFKALNTYLLYHAENFDWEFVRYLVVKGADLNVKSSDGLSPWQQMFLNLDHESRQFCLTNGANPNDLITGEEPLFVAIKKGDQVLFRALLHSGAKVNVTNAAGETPLMVAVENEGHLPLEEMNYLKTLVNSGAKINVFAKDGQTAMHRMVAKKNLEALKYLMNKGGELKDLNHEGKSLLILAAIAEDEGMLAFLIEQKVDLDIQDLTGETAMFKLVRAGRKDLVKLLIKNGAHIYRKNKQDQSCIELAITRGDLDLYYYLITRDNLQDNFSWNYVHKAIFAQDHRKLEKYIGWGTHLSIAARGEFTPLMMAVERKNMDMVEMLVEAKAELNTQSVDGYTALNFAVRYAHEDSDALEYLLEKGAHVNLMTKKGVSLLMEAQEVGVVETLLEAGVDIDTRDSNGETVLMRSIRAGREDLAQTLIENKADLDFQDAQGRTALLLAYEMLPSLFDLLIEKGADLNLKDKKQESIIFKSLHQSDENRFKALIDAKVNLDGKNQDGQTLLHLAILAKKNNFAELLLENGAKVNLKNGQRETALHLALAQGDEKLLKLLLRHKASLIERNAKGESPIQSVVMRNTQSSVACLRVLLASGANANEKLEEKSLLYWVLDHQGVNYIEKARLLVKNGANVNFEFKKTLLSLEEKAKIEQDLKKELSEDELAKLSCKSSVLEKAVESYDLALIKAMVNEGALVTSAVRERAEKQSVIYSGAAIYEYLKAQAL